MYEVSSIWNIWVIVMTPNVELSDTLNFSENMEKPF
jgi:hypothetical protein